MVDESLPFPRADRGLRYLFLDLNAYFASVEQQEQHHLRGKPTVVVPVEADTSFCIAASYEAKACGVKTGTMIRDAKAMCPGLHIVKARPPAYVAYHQRIIEVCETVLPVDRVCSIDEMRFRLLGEEREPDQARRLAERMKSAIARDVGDQMRCSIGIAPNAFLAKIATELQKPNGLVTIEASDLPQRLYELKLTDFTGINRKMAARLQAAQIFTAEDLCRAERTHMIRAFGSVVGERYYYLLRGYEVDLDTEDRKSLSHSHVLPPALRTDTGCREVLLRLIQKASARLRANRAWPGEMAVYVRGFDRSWKAKRKITPTQDTLVLNEVFGEMWRERDFERPRSVGVVFSDLHDRETVTPSLFDQDDSAEREELMAAVDALNQKFGKNKIFLAGMERTKDTASEKIAFNKTWLFAEGKGDHEWPDTFRGLRETP